MSDAEVVNRAGRLPGVNAIAVIDDAFIPISSNQLPEPERIAVIDLLGNLDEPNALEDFRRRGFDKQALTARADEALEVLSEPDSKLGDAFVAVVGASMTLAKLIEQRRMMKRIAIDMCDAAGCEVAELGPRDLPDLRGFQIVFVDYFLEGEEDNGSLAVSIAKDLEDGRDPASAQQIVLMSSAGRVRSFRKHFRAEAGVNGAAFSFVAKSDMDEPWKVRAQLEMFAHALPYSHTIGNYIAATKENVTKARDRIINVLDDLDLGDFAYIQKLALREDGHPLGDYLSWLFSSHFVAYAFEGDLRTAQRRVDKIDFEKELLSPAEPSLVVALLYHDAQFSRSMGELGPHPRATEGGEFVDVPLVGLGDVFVDAGWTKAVVVLSADCDLAFAPREAREPDRGRSVILISGEPRRIEAREREVASSTIEGTGNAAEVYRIDWEFQTYRTVALGDLEGYLRKGGFDLSDRDRLRPLYALKLQQEFSSHVFRVGPPIMPPVRIKLRGEIFCTVGGKSSIEVLEPEDISMSLFQDKFKMRLTLYIVGRLRQALEGLLAQMTERLRELQEAGRDDEALMREVSALRPKIDAMHRRLDEDERWLDLHGDLDLPEPGNPKKLMQGLYVVYGTEWAEPSEPAILLQVTKPARE